MPDLTFTIEGAEPVSYAAAPMLALKLRIANKPANEMIHSIILTAQIQIEATRRPYDSDEQAQLRDLFGEPEHWSQTLRTMLWTHASVNVRPFSDQTLADLYVPCTFDFNVAATKYFHGLKDGNIPLALLFSGTAFYQDDDLGLQVAQVPWEKEARYRLPVDVWRRVVDQHYPNTAWLTLGRDVFERLLEFKVRHGIPTFEQTMERLLAEVDEGVLS